MDVLSAQDTSRTQPHQCTYSSIKITPRKYPWTSPQSDDINSYSEYHGSSNTILQSIGQLTVSSSNQTTARHTATSTRNGLGPRTPSMSSHCFQSRMLNKFLQFRTPGRRSRKVFRHAIMATISRLRQRTTRRAT